MRPVPLPSEISPPETVISPAKVVLPLSIIIAAVEPSPSAKILVSVPLSQKAALKAPAEVFK